MENLSKKETKKAIQEKTDYKLEIEVSVLDEETGKTGLSFMEFGDFNIMDGVIKNAIFKGLKDIEAGNDRTDEANMFFSFANICKSYSQNLLEFKKKGSYRNEVIKSLDETAEKFMKVYDEDINSKF